MSEDLRAVLEAIAFGEDSRVTPSDRLRAIEHLSRLEEALPQPNTYAPELAGLEGNELDRRLDAHLAEQVASDIFGEAKGWPVLAQLVGQEIERRARALAKDLHVAQVEAEVERRVEERLCQLATSAPVEEAPVESTVAQDRTPPGVMAGFSSRSSRSHSESVFRKRRLVA